MPLEWSSYLPFTPIYKFTLNSYIYYDLWEKRTFQEIRLISFLLEILDEDAIVYKLLGPVLVKQEKEIALQTIKNRKDFMESELKK